MSDQPCLIPPAEKIQERLAEVERERSRLRKLLKLAQESEATSAPPLPSKVQTLPKSDIKS